jgi:tetratricopeptide (TPR) repeat protein
MPNTPQQRKLPIYYYIIRIVVALAILVLIGALVVNYLLKKPSPSFLEEGQVAYLDSRFEDARDKFTFAIAREPQNPEAYIGRGFASIKLGKPDDAIVDFEKAIELDPDGDTRPYEQLGSIALIRSEFDEALVYFNHAIEIAGDNAEALADAYYNQGIAYAGLFEYESALDSFTKALEYDDTVPDYYRRVGDSYYILNKRGEALNAYEQYLSMETPDDVQPYVEERVQSLQGN